MNTRKPGSTTRRTTSSRSSRTKKPATIDLEAKKPDAGKEDAKSSSTKPKATVSASKSATPASSKGTTGTTPKSSKTSSEGKTNPPLGRAAAKPAAEPKTDTKTETPKTESTQTKKSRTGLVPMIVSGFVGGVSVAALLAGLQYGDMLNLPVNNNPSATINEVSAEQYNALKAQVEAIAGSDSDKRISDLENVISELNTTAQPANEDLTAQVGVLETELADLKSVLDNLATVKDGETPDLTQLSAALAQTGQRMDKLETTLSEMLASGNEGIAETDERIGELSKKLDAVSSDSDKKIAPLADSIESARSSIETLSSEVKRNTEHFEKLQSDASQLQQSIASVKASEKVARSVAVNALGSALKNDDSLVLAIASLESLGSKSAETERLSELASTGIPTVNELLTGLEALTRTVQNPVRKDEGGTLSEKFWANARNLVTFRSSGPQEGDTTIAILSRVKAGIELGQLDNALNEWKLLPIEVQASGKQWSGMLEKRIEAYSLYQHLADKLQNEAS